MSNRNLSERDPHKRIIEILTPPDEECDPLVPTSIINWEDTVEGFTEDQIEAALKELIHAGIVVDRDNPHTGDRLVGLREWVDRSEAEYDDLKTSVFERAEARGLSPKWKRGDGWRLDNADGEIVAVGNMRELSEYLEAP